MRIGQVSKTAKVLNIVALGLAIATMMAISTRLAESQTFSVLHTFHGGTDGSFPGTPVTFDSAGNMYGQNDAGGIAASCDGLGCGTVWELSPVGSAWSEKTLFDFANSKTGGVPVGSLVLDSSGDLLGATIFGGGSKDCSGDDGLSGCGAIFQLSPNGSGRFAESIAFAFNGENNGGLPESALVPDGLGNYYGTTETGGPNNCKVSSCGVVYELSPNGSGGWTQSVIFNFSGGTGGGVPDAQVVMDAAGNLYGTTQYAGEVAACGGDGCGVVYELSLVSGSWQETVLYTFTGRADGALPVGALIFDTAGNLYGTTESGGNLSAPACSAAGGCGVVFELSPMAGGGYQETVLHAFTGEVDGGFPTSALVLNGGSLYGATSSGGRLSGCGGFGCGLVFELSPVTGGGWKETGVHLFTGGADGAFPSQTLTTDASGNLFGVAGVGGDLTECTGNAPTGCGVVFKIVP